MKPRFATPTLERLPAGKFDPIDPKALAKSTQSDLAWKNPRRFWMMDHQTIALAGEARDFDGLEYR